MKLYCEECEKKVEVEHITGDEFECLDCECIITQESDYSLKN